MTGNVERVTPIFDGFRVAIQECSVRPAEVASGQGKLSDWEYLLPHGTQASDITGPSALGN